MYLLQICPSDSLFLYETCIQLNNLKESGIEHLARILVYSPPGREIHSKWKSLEELFPEASFFYYEGDNNINSLIANFQYIPLLRIWCWIQHLREVEYNEPVFYHDSDVLFPKGIEWIQPFLEDDIVYQSDTSSYLSSSYLLSKEKDVLPHKLESYKKLDVLTLFANTAGISKDILVANKDNTGGAQTLLKGASLTPQFWEDVLSTCLNILTLSRSLNKQYFESENKGFQTWALGDMGGLLWNLWKYNLSTGTPSSFNFSWADSRIDQLDKNIYHNTGMVHQPVELDGVQHILYNKKGLPPAGNSYILPWNHPQYQNAFSHPQINISNQFCSYYYHKEVEKCRQLYNHL